MKKLYRLFIIFSALFLIAGTFPSLTVKADSLPAENTLPETSPSSSPAADIPADTALPEAAFSLEETVPSASPAAEAEEFSDSAALEPPAFYAKIEYNFQGYVVMGTFTEFPSDICSARPIYSLDGEIWNIIDYMEWDLQYLESEDAGEVSKLQNQPCLLPSQEPLKGYLAETLDSFYIKLRITRENGIIYDSQPVCIERSSTAQPVPEEYSLYAVFDSSLCVRERNPFRIYGQYQLTVNEDASWEDIAALLPSTLPVEVQLENQQDIWKGIINCPVTWKSQSLPALTAGDSITISDAAEEIIIPGGTLVNTPAGSFQLKEPLPLDDGMASTDEVRLILNVVSENESPEAGVSLDRTGLEIYFDLKPTGASSFQVYSLPEGASQWTKLFDSSIPETINSHFSSAGGLYALLLSNEQEPLRSYLAAQNEGEAATPFLIGLEIEGGVYDKQQLILPWPGTYEGPVKIPVFGAGAGGNENNAGADNKGDSTSDGRRPNLPEASEEDSKIDISIEDQTHPAAADVPDNAAVTIPIPKMQPAADVVEDIAADQKTSSSEHLDEPLTETANEPAAEEQAGGQMNAPAAGQTKTDAQITTPDPQTPSLSPAASTLSDSPVEAIKKALPPLLASTGGIAGIAAIGKLGAVKLAAGKLAAGKLTTGKLAAHRLKLAIRKFFKLK